MKETSKYLPRCKTLEEIVKPIDARETCITL